MSALDEADLAADPVAMFERWWADAAVEAERDAMALATVDADGVPSLRFVLLKGFDERGWVFYTNAGSVKGRALSATGRAALAFRWATLDRQVRVAGTAEPVAPEESDEYFASRARRSQLGAWASAQSQPIASRADLDAALEGAVARFEGGDVPRPPHWHGWRVAPASVEFWQGRDNRLHDRFRYSPADGGGWQVVRLSP